MKRVLSVIVCGILCFGSAMSSVGAGSWQETMTVPAEYEKVEYVDSGKIFWLQRPKEKQPKQFFNLSGKLVTLPEGTERGGTKGDLGILSIANASDDFDQSTLYSVVQFAAIGKRSMQGIMEIDSQNIIIPLGEHGDVTVYRDGYVTTGTWDKMSIYKNGQQLATDLKKLGVISQCRILGIPLIRKKE